jgi:hypothetical protein
MRRMSLLRSWEELPAEFYKHQAPTELRTERRTFRVCKQYPERRRPKGCRQFMKLNVFNSQFAQVLIYFGDSVRNGAEQRAFSVVWSGSSPGSRAAWEADLN